MQIDSLCFGSLEIESDKVIEFPQGLPGFIDCKRFALVRDADQASIVYTLHSIDRPEVIFSVAPPNCFGLNYEFELSDEETELLKVENVDDVALLLILRRDDNPHRRNTDLPVTASLSAPLVINTAQRRGIQKVIGKVGCDITLRPVPTR